METAMSDLEKYINAEDAIATIDKLKALHEKSFAILLTAIPKRQLENAGKLFTYLEANPIVDITKTAQQLGLAYNTTSRLISAFVKLGLLRQTNTKNKNRVYAYEEYLEILRKGTELGE
jgi:Fic family protein